MIYNFLCLHRNKEERRYKKKDLCYLGTAEQAHKCIELTEKFKCITKCLLVREATCKQRTPNRSIPKTSLSSESLSEPPPLFCEEEALAESFRDSGSIESNYEAVVNLLAVDYGVQDGTRDVEIAPPTIEAVIDLIRD